MLNFPLMSVVVPDCAFLIFTVAKEMGSEFSSVTVPVTFTCAIAGIASRQHNRLNKYFFIFSSMLDKI